MKEDYLWDKSGSPDPEVERLEQLLGGLRHRGAAPELPKPGRRFSWQRYAAIAAALVVAASSAWWGLPYFSGGWSVSRIEGTSLIAGSAMREEAELRVGQTLETGADGRVELKVGQIGLVRVEPGTKLRLLESRPAEHRLAMDRGKIVARIWAPPKLFFVDMPAVTAVDLGCAYTLEVDERGNGRIHVTLGWVGFETNGLESLIPAGAACRTREKEGPGVPYYLDAADGFQQAVERWDSGERRDEDLQVILREARPRDGLTLWHLLTRVRAERRGDVYDRLVKLVPPPFAVTREGIERLDRAMLEAWWDNLGLDPMNWWKLWKGDWPPKVGK
ncbi:MAG: FecR domain-containing protein [Bryobacterales bacterium]|nr:FecR domain-containing protein [Bryobacterales bacterium]